MLIKFIVSETRKKDTFCKLIAVVYEIVLRKLFSRENVNTLKIEFVKSKW